MQVERNVIYFSAILYVNLTLRNLCSHIGGITSLVF
jgi:hypothetical protein